MAVGIVQNMDWTHRLDPKLDPKLDSKLDTKLDNSDKNNHGSTRILFSTPPLVRMSRNLSLIDIIIIPSKVS